MAKLRYEDFIDLILNLDVLGNNIDKDFKKLIFDNKDNTNFGLIRDYFFDNEFIKELKNKLLDEEVLEGEKFERFMEQLIVMYPLSKKLLETIIYNNRDSKVEKKLLNKLMFKNNVFINGIGSYVESIDACFSETKEEIENLKDIIKNIEIENNIDILKSISEHKKSQFVVGFAAETNSVKDYAISKMSNKNLDMIVANDVSLKDSGFGSDFNKVTIITKESEIETEVLTNREIADKILAAILEKIC